MARSKSPSEALLDDVSKAAVTSVLKPAGFRASGRTYHRRLGETVQVVNVQVSTPTTWDVKHFYVNAAVAFDAICRLTGQPVTERPKEYECHDRGFSHRLEDLVPGAPDVWQLQAGQDPAPVVEGLRSAIERLRDELDLIRGPRDYSLHRWFSRVRPKPENAQILYALGELDRAWQEVDQLANFFADRRNANRPEWWVEKLGLADLRDRAGGTPPT